MGKKKLHSDWGLGQESLDQMIPEVPSNLVFYESMKKGICLPESNMS